MFPPLSALVFATLPAALRNEGAAMFALTRSMGSSLGISFLQTQTIQNTATVEIAAGRRRAARQSGGAIRHARFRFRAAPRCLPG